MNEYIITFGFGQGYDNGYVTVLAPDENSARQKMFEEFGDRWCGSYTSKEEAGVDKYGLWEVAYLEWGVNRTSALLDRVKELESYVFSLERKMCGLQKETSMLDERTFSLVPIGAKYDGS